MQTDKLDLAQVWEYSFFPILQKPWWSTSPSWLLVFSPIHMGVGPDDLPGSIQFYSLKTWLQLHLDWIISFFYFM